MTMKNPEFVQVKLRSMSTGKVQTCWVDKIHKFKEGSVVSLRGKTEPHEVIRKYNTRKRKSELNPTWKVGGLS